MGFVIERDDCKSILGWSEKESGRLSSWEAFWKLKLSAAWSVFRYFNTSESISVLSFGKMFRQVLLCWLAQSTGKVCSDTHVGSVSPLVDFLTTQSLQQPSKLHSKPFNCVASAIFPVSNCTSLSSHDAYISVFQRNSDSHGKKLIYFNCMQFTFPFYYFQVPRCEFLASTNARKESGARKTLKRFPFRFLSPPSSFTLFLMCVFRSASWMKVLLDESLKCF